MDDEQTVEHFLEIIKDEADRLKFLIKDLFALTEVEDKEFSLIPAKIEDSVASVRKMFSDRSSKKNISLQVELEQDLPCVLMVPEKIEQVLTNLVDNAFKYTPKGGSVVLRLYHKEEENRIYVEVEDDGIGIPEADQNRIFERFYRVDKARSREMGGTGIGLSIVKHIIQGHQSEIEVISTEGEGTLFRFYLQTTSCSLKE